MDSEDVGIVSLGSYVPYFYLERNMIGGAWGTGGMKGRRSMANSDEDSITMSVEAARDCLKAVPQAQITHLYSATTTSPYSEKSSATLISTACDLSADVLSVDFNTSLRCGTAALKLALDTAAADEKATVLVVAADMRDASPKSSEEMLFGDAAAAAVVGHGNLLAELKSFASVDNEIHDYWRNAGDQAVLTTESRFAIDEGYMVSMPQAIQRAMEKAGITPAEVAHVAMSTPGMKEYQKVGKKCGFRPEQMQEPLMMEIGNCGAAQALLVLCAALETARAGDNIVVADYGSGANAFVFRVTEKINAVRRDIVSKYLNSRSAFTDYARFLSFRGLLTPKQGEPFRLPAAPSITWREQTTYLKLHASTCKVCGSKTFPISRVCYACHAKDQYTEESRTDAALKLFSFSVDRLAGRSDDPVVIQSIADDQQGIRFYMTMTDVQEDQIKIGMDLNFTFRKMHDLANFPNYYWKFRPIRDTGTKE